jgi:two-component system sensor histidine kinase YesM
MRKRIFLRRFFIYFIAILLPLFTALFSYSIIAKSQLLLDAQKNTIQSLTAISDTVELSLANATYQKNLFSSTPRFTLSLKKILAKNKMDYSDVVIMNSLYTLINSSINSNLLVRSIYLSLDNHDQFISSGYNILSLNDSSDSEWHALYLQHDSSEQIWTSKRTYYEYDRPQEVLSVFMRFINAHGVIVVNMDLERLQKIVEQIHVTNNEAIFLFNTQKELLISNKAGTDFLSADSQNFFSNISLSALPPSTPKLIQIQDKNYYLTVKTSSIYGIYFVSLINARNYNTLAPYFNTTFMIIAVCSVVMALVMSFFITYKNIKQAYHLINIFSDAEKGIFDHTPPKQRLLDEYDIIINGIIMTFINNDFLKTQLAEKQYKKKVAELTALQLQINPHFLFNTLQLLDITSYHQTGAHTEINTIIQELSAILKYVLKPSHESVTIRDELQHLKTFADINYRRYKNIFILYFDYEEDILSYCTFRLLLQPLIENSLYHGIRSLNGARMGYIKVKIYKQNDDLHFYVIDNGVGMNKERLGQLKTDITQNSIQTSHIGLINTNRRLILNFGVQSQMHIMSKLNMGTVIDFKIPCIKQQDYFKYLDSNI